MNHLKILSLYALLITIAATTPVSCNYPSAPTDALPVTPPPAPPPIVETVDPPSVPPPPPKQDSRSLAELHVAACTAADGSWSCKDPKPKTLKATGNSPITPISWTIPNWYIDPAGTAPGDVASDQNDCVTATSACLTFGEIIQHRLGTFVPNLYQVTTFHQLTGQALNTDLVFLDPHVANGGQAILIGTPIPNGATFTPGGLTAKTRGGPGQLLTLTTVPGTVAAKNMICKMVGGLNSSCAFVDSIIAGPNAVMSQPIPIAALSTVGIPTLSEDNGWLAGDTYQAYTLPLINLKQWRPSGGDVGAGGANTSACTGWVQFLEIADSSGTTASEYPMTTDSAVRAMSACRIDPRVHVGVEQGRGTGVYIIGCDITGAVTHFSGSATYYGGIYRVGISTGSGFPTVDGDIILHGGSFAQSAFFQGGAVYSDNAITATGGGVLKISTALWGSAAVNVLAGSMYWNQSGTTFALSLLTSGALKLGTATTGCFITPGTGVWACAVNITPANLDTDNGLNDPQTGARFANTN